MAKPSAAHKIHKAALGKEMASLAKQVMAAIKDPALRGEVKGIGKEAWTGMRATGGRIAKALHKVKQSEAAHEIQSQAQRIYENGKLQGGKTAKRVSQRVSADLGKGLHQLGIELTKLAKKLPK